MGKVLDVLKTIGIGTVTVGACIIEAIAETTLDANSDKVGYGDAIEAITDSDMWGSDKAKAIKALPENKSSDFYKGIISIVTNSDMWSSEKARIITSLVEKQ